MRVAYITTLDYKDVGSWSGTISYIYKAVEYQGFEVDVLGPFPRYAEIRNQRYRMKSFWFNRLLRQKLGNYSREREHYIAITTGRHINEQLQKAHYDLILSHSGPPVAYLETEIPIAIWADATFHSLITSYPEFKNKTVGYYRDGESLEKLCLQRATFCFFSSQWAAQSAIADYGIDPSKVKVIPFGANVDETVSEEQVRKAIAARDSQTLRLLFIGFDFARKGGPKVLEVLSELLQLGVKAELRIIGCNPEVPEHLKPHTQVLGFISKSSPEGRRSIAESFLSSHWLIMLPTAECYGLVFAEANRYGVPSIANAVGGIPTIISQGKNGELFDHSSSPAEIASHIAKVHHDPARYFELATASYRCYCTRLNWKTAGQLFADLVVGDLSATASIHENSNRNHLNHMS